MFSIPIIAAFLVLSFGVVGVASPDPLGAVMDWGPIASGIVMALAFLRYLAFEGDRASKTMNKISDDNSQIHKELRAEIEKMGERAEHSQQLFSEQIRRVAENQTKILQDTIGVVSSLQASQVEMRRSMDNLHFMLVRILPPPAEAVPAKILPPSDEPTTKLS